jgi:hypothetical protein
MRFWPLQRLTARAALCGVASFRTIPLRRCPPAQWLALADFRSRPKSPPSAHLWPVSSSPAVFLGTDSTRPPLSWVIRRLLSSAWRTGPMNASVRRGLAALLSRSGSARGVWSFAVLLRPVSARKAFRITPPAVLSIRPGLGLFYPKDRPACSVIVSAGQSGLPRSRLLGLLTGQPYRPDSSGSAATALDFASSRVLGRVSVRRRIARWPGLVTLCQPPVPGPWRASTPAFA